MNLWSKKSYDIKDDKLIDLLTPILLIANTDIFIDELNKKCKNNFSEENINELKEISLNQIEENVVNIRYYFLPDRNFKTESIILKEKIGRNSPCP